MANNRLSIISFFYPICADWVYAATCVLRIAPHLNLRRKLLQSSSLGSLRCFFWPQRHHWLINNTVEIVISTRTILPIKIPYTMYENLIFHSNLLTFCRFPFINFMSSLFFCNILSILLSMNPHPPSLKTINLWLS